MSPRRHSWPALVGAVAACTLLSGCFGSGGTDPTASHRTRHHRSHSPSAPVSPSTSAPTSSSSSNPAAAALTFSPRSGGKHLDDCERLVPGDDPAEFLYYPVLVTPATDVTLDSLATDHTTGVVDAGSWVAPATPSSQTGTYKGWPPPKIITQGSQLQWDKRVPAKGAQLAAGSTYSVFVRLQVDPTPGDSMSRGLRLSYHDAGGGAETSTWKATTTFSMSC
jgi:hypothetical protein